MSSFVLQHASSIPFATASLISCATFMNMAHYYIILVVAENQPPNNECISDAAYVCVCVALVLLAYHSHLLATHKKIKTCHLQNKAMLEMKDIFHNVF